MPDPTSKWPKTPTPLTPEQKRINDEFMKLWHEVLPKRFGIVEQFNHKFPGKHSRPGFKTTLEIGAGLGEHLHYERLGAEGCPIGSGAMESTCSQFQDRFKRTGPFWSLPGERHLMALELARRNDDWDEIWTINLQ